MEKTDNPIETRGIHKGEWYWIHRAVIQEFIPRIGSMGLAVYNLLASMADRNQLCFPSQRYIAQTLGCSRTTVMKALRKLEGAALIRIERKKQNHSLRKRGTFSTEFTKTLQKEKNNPAN